MDKVEYDLDTSGGIMEVGSILNMIAIYILFRIFRIEITNVRLRLR